MKRACNILREHSEAPGTSVARAVWTKALSTEQIAARGLYAIRIASIWGVSFERSYGGSQ